MPVGRPGLQAQIMRECVENQSPDVIICDESTQTIYNLRAAQHCYTSRLTCCRYIRSQHDGRG